MKFLVYALLICGMLVLVSSPFTWPFLAIGGLVWFIHDMNNPTKYNDDPYHWNDEED